jgi:hypothetical protein
MTARDSLSFYPFVVVRIGCRQCSRRGAYRLARLAAKFGPETTLRDMLDRFSYDCIWREDRRGKAKDSASCGIYLPDLEQPKPPDLPPGVVKLRVIKGSKTT